MKQGKIMAQAWQRTEVPSIDRHSQKGTMIRFSDSGSSVGPVTSRA